MRFVGNLSILTMRMLFRSVLLLVLLALNSFAMVSSKQSSLILCFAGSQLTIQCSFLSLLRRTIINYQDHSQYQDLAEANKVLGLHYSGDHVLPEDAVKELESVAAYLQRKLDEETETILNNMRAKGRRDEL
jgi:hypothetical protein